MGTVELLSIILYLIFAFIIAFFMVMTYRFVKVVEGFSNSYKKKS